MELQIPYRVGNSILNDTNPVIYRKGKTMYHLNLPYREMCDSDYYSICAEVSPKNILWRKARSGRKSITAVAWMERREDSGSRGVPRSCSNAVGDTAETVRLKFHGISERQEQHNAVWAIRRVKVQVSKQRVLEQRVLCGYGGKEREPNCGVHQEPAERGPTGGTTYDEWGRPVYGQQVTIPTQLADRIMSFTHLRKTEGFARICITTRFSRGCLLRLFFVIGFTHQPYVRFITSLCHSLLNRCDELKSSVWLQKAGFHQGGHVLIIVFGWRHPVERSACAALLPAVPMLLTEFPIQRTSHKKNQRDNNVSLVLFYAPCWYVGATVW